MQKETSTRPFVILAIITCVLVAVFGIRSYVLKRWGQEIETAKVVADMVFGNLHPSKGEVKVVYDNTPLPRNITQQELDEALEKEKNNLVFVDSFRGYAWRSEIDDFLIPNGNFSMKCSAWEISWEKVISLDGSNILRDPTKDELEWQNEYHPVGMEFYLSDHDAKTAYAIGRMEIKVPSQFDKLSFDASDVGKTLSAGEISFTLKACENDYIQIAHDGRKVKGGFFPDFVAFDNEGRRIAKNSEDIDVIGDGFSKGEEVDDDTWFWEKKYDGRIAKVEVYVPKEPLSSTIAVKATTEPNISLISTPTPLHGPRFLPNSRPPQFVSMDHSTLKKESKIVSTRSEFINAANVPGVAASLPSVDNSAYAEYDWGEPVLKGSWGRKIEYELWDSDEEAYFENKEEDNDTLLNYKQAIGTAKIRYPAKIKVLAFTPSQLKHGDIEVQFEGPKIKIRGIEDLPGNQPERLAQYQAFHANGRRLKKLNYSSSDNDWDVMAFWGEPKELRVIQVEEWIDVEIPFDLEPAPKR